MKKRYIPYFTFVVLLTVVFGLNIYMNKRENNIENEITTESTAKSEKINEYETPISKTENKTYYLIKYNNGHLNVYNSDNTIIDTIYVDFDSMREYDRKQFIQGVSVSNIDEIKHITEDFSE